MRTEMTSVDMHIHYSSPSFHRGFACTPNRPFRDSLITISISHTIQMKTPQKASTEEGLREITTLLHHGSVSPRSIRIGVGER